MLPFTTCIINIEVYHRNLDIITFELRLSTDLIGM